MNRERAEQYVTVDDVHVVDRILAMGKGYIKQACRQVPVFPQDRLLLGMLWNNRVYVDMVLPFGLRSAPLLFMVAADMLQWIILKNGRDTSLTISLPWAEQAAAI